MGSTSSTIFAVGSEACGVQFGNAKKSCASRAEAQQAASPDSAAVDATEGAAAGVVGVGWGCGGGAVGAGVWWAVAGWGGVVGCLLCYNHSNICHKPEPISRGQNFLYAA